MKKAYLQAVSESQAYEEMCDSYIVLRLTNKSIAQYFLTHKESIFLCEFGSDLISCLKCTEIVACGCGKNPSCRRCRGTGMYERATGGKIEVDGAAMTWLGWMRLKKFPKHAFWTSKHEVGGKWVCSECGGRGVVYRAQITTCFIPREIYYVTNGTLIRDGFKNIDAEEAAARWPGRTGARKFEPGFYAFADGTKPEASQELFNLDGVDFTLDIHGDIGELKEPFAYVSKYWPGLKLWEY